MTKHKTLKVGIVQQACTADVEANKQNLKRNIADVAAQGAELVVLQELHNSLYFCQVESTDNFDLAEPIPGPSTGFYSELAAASTIWRTAGGKSVCASAGCASAAVAASRMVARWIVMNAPRFESRSVPVCSTAVRPKSGNSAHPVQKS